MTRHSVGCCPRGFEAELIDLPPGLLQAISAENGGQLSIVIGAGCSFEPPTSIPLSRALSTEVNRKLELDRVLAPGECVDPSDLAALTTLVYGKTNSQYDVVSRFPINQLKVAAPNIGYRILIALMVERAISYVLSLNFDLAVQNAAAELGVSIEIVDAAGQAIPALPTLVHLHGNANGTSETFVLRSETIDGEWKGAWEQVVAAQILAAPSLLFAGLGSAAPVLSDTIGMIKEAVGAGKLIYQADIAPHAKSYFAQQLAVLPESYVVGGWCAVMEALAARVAAEQIHRLRTTGQRVQTENQAPANEIEAFSQFVDAYQDVSLLTLGKLRAYGRLDTKASYRSRTEIDEEAIVEPIVKLSEICAQHGLSARPTAAGVWRLERDGKLVATALLASGMGSRKLAAMEPGAHYICRTIAERAMAGPDFVIVGGTLASQAPTTDSVDLIADSEAGDIIDGPTGPLIMATNAADLAVRVEQRLNAA